MANSKIQMLLLVAAGLVVVLSLPALKLGDDNGDDNGNGGGDGNGGGVEPPPAGIRVLSEPALFIFID